MDNPRIMIVEDENIIAMDLKMRLLTLGYTVAAMAASGEDAIHKAEQVRPDLTLMDIVLRGEMDGIQAAEHVQGHLGIPVIYITAYSDETTVQRARLTEPYGYVLKPFEDRELKTVIEMAIYKSTMERRLRDSEARFRLLAENSTDLISRQTADGVYDYVSPACKRILGYTPEEMLGKSAFEFIHPVDAAAIKAKDAEGMWLNGFATLTLRTRRKDGAYIYLECAVRAIRHPETGAIQETQVTSRDVTERVLAEQAQGRLLAIIEATPDLVSINDLQGHIVYLNSAGRKMLDVGADEDVSQMRFLDHLPTEQAYELADKGFPDKPTFEQWQGERIFINRQAQEIPVSLVILTHRSSEGAVEFTSTIARDISEQKKAERELQFLSTHDSLTGLFNRAYFETEMERLQTSSRLPVSVIMVDVDELKVVNDTQGHAVGDEALRRAAQVLKRTFRAEDIVARIGGDEFAILLPGANEALCAQLLERVEKTLDTHNGERNIAPLRLSYGTATRAQNELLASTLKQADARMYQAKMAKRKSAASSDDST